MNNKYKNKEMCGPWLVGPTSLVSSSDLCHACPSSFALPCCFCCRFAFYFCCYLLFVICCLLFVVVVGVLLLFCRSLFVLFVVLLWFIHQILCLSVSLSSLSYRALKNNNSPQNESEGKRHIEQRDEERGREKKIKGYARALA